jgi:hypothetical protein
VLSCDLFSCGIEGASLCSTGFAAAGEDAATVSIGLDASTSSPSYSAGLEFELTGVAQSVELA